MIDFRTIFEHAYPGKDKIYEEIILPIFRKAVDLRKTALIALAESDKQTILQASIIAQVSGTFPITFADVTVQSSVHLKRNRVSIQNCLRAIMEDNTSALIFFHFADNLNEWRVSFVHRAETLKTSTSAKRYTYLCGTEHPCRTIAERFGKLARRADDSDITVADMLDAFSVEALSKEFFTELFKWYKWALSVVTFPSGDTTRDSNGNFNVKQSKANNELNMIRLITRLMFVWFIKQKDLIPSWIFDVNELQKVLTDFIPDSRESGNYYNAIIQNLFFATLNKKIEDRAFADDTKIAYNTQFGVKIFYRDNSKATFFKEPREKIIERFKPVPFLNGGLFECLDELKDDATKTKNIECFTDGFSREPEWMAFIPNQLFWQNDNDHEGLLHLFHRYNFTVEENTQNDVQIALDPELLGKVFENLLGTYNPETRDTARKASGSFYTPREIVDFMIDESLKNYLLHTVTGITPEQIDTLFNDEIEHYDYANQNSIVQAIKKVKILDPACGSGAFPMSALHKIVHIIKKCNGSNESQQSVYQLKLTLIEQCLYGIDIQPIAVQICKLRFFISLICEQEKNNSAEDNYGISHLPNLETKFVAADTLIGLRQEDAQYLDIVNTSLSQLKNELACIRAQHFKASTAKEKYECREQDRKKRQEIIDMLATQFLSINPILVQTLERDIKTIEVKIKELPVIMVDAQMEQSLFDSAPTTLFQKDKNEEERENLKKLLKDKRKQLADAKTKKSLDKSTDHELRERAVWNPYNQNAVSSFFDADWMFNVKNGFDIVIGNPPYISTKGISTDTKKKYESEFGFSDDTYNLFTYKGLELTKENGSLNYIIPKTFWTTQTKRNMRNLILDKNIQYVFDTANPFETVLVDTCIIQISNTQFEKSNTIKFLDGSENLHKPIIFEPVLQEVYRNTQNMVIFKPTEKNLKIWQLYGAKVKELYDRWWNKIETSKKISENAVELKKYRESLKPGDIALLGCLTEGGQGLATGNNGKYIAIRKNSKWAANVLNSRPKKLIAAMEAEPQLAKELGNINNIKEYLASLSETEIAEQFDSIKEKYGRDIFGQGYIYKLIDDAEIADVETLTDDEKENGIDTKKPFYVPYDKGDKDGNRWYLETPFAIAWSKENVQFLKTNSGKKGVGMPVVRNPQFNFKEGFCWTDINTTFLKCRLKTKSINDVKSMSMYGLLDSVPEYFIISVINSTFMSNYVDVFINNTQTFQINDARQIPLVIPNNKQLLQFKYIYEKAIEIKRDQFLSGLSVYASEKMLIPIQQQLDKLVEELYCI
ncbi:restriction endonuclease [Treponema medium]|uniref:Eco57I restriction-modification methylase domain-containing protein n=1 Tax=Treponema medium TaxID=58231 RepID=UPI0019807774|nr:N-6 DNA methylase [Treponema medium]QSH91969.1 restriction endonuclease [Treponema medium]